jgi:AraC-like DNA-binding protein
LEIPDSLFIRLFQKSIYSPYKYFLADLLMEHRSDYTHLHGSLKPQVASVEETQSDISLAEIIREIVSPAPGSAQIINGHLIRLIYQLALEYRFDLAPYSQEDMRRLLFDEIKSDIQRDCCNITIEHLQDKYYYNRNYFNYLIKEQSGMTFQELRQTIRLEEAARLLLETDTNIDDIVRIVGYDNLGFFYRLFNARYGVTPRKYRLCNR